MVRDTAGGGSSPALRDCQTVRVFSAMPMSFGLKIDDWTDATLQEVVATQQAEGLTVEFKRDLPLTSPNDKKEVAKDISAMANAAGGWIIYGIDEQPSGPKGVMVAGAVTPLSTAGAAQQVDNIIAGAVTPRPRFRAKEVPSGAAYCLVVQVTPSTDDLHMVTSYKDNRYYWRTELGARPMTEPEVRTRYTLMAHRKAEAGAFVRQIVEQELVGPPDQGFLVALVPHTLREVLDPATFKSYDEVFACLGHVIRSRISPSAIGLETTGSESLRFRLRRDGAVTVACPAFGEGKWYPRYLLNYLLEGVSIARAAWPRYGVVEPVTVALRARLPEDLKTETADSWTYPVPLVLGKNQSFEVQVSASDIHDNPAAVARPVMDRLWQHMGETRCTSFFDEQGNFERELAADLKRRGLI